MSSEADPVEARAPRQEDPAGRGSAEDRAGPTARSPDPERDPDGPAPGRVERAARAVSGLLAPLRDHPEAALLVQLSLALVAALATSTLLALGARAAILWWKG